MTAQFPQLDAVLFDMDGVLVDSFDAWVVVIDSCLRRRAAPLLGSAGLRRFWGQGIAADCRTLFPGESPERLVHEYDAEFASRLDLVRREPGAEEALMQLRAAQMGLAVVTNSPATLARAVLDRVGLLAPFDAVCGGDEVPEGKPAPDVVLLGLERLGAAPGRSVLVGDTDLDIRAARAAGVTSVGYRVNGDFRIDDLRGLTRLLKTIR